MTMPLELLGAAKGLGSVAKSAFGYARKRFFPPKVGYQLTPSNLLEVVRPFSNYRKALELLGEPHHVWNAQASYRFADSLLQIEHDANDVITAVTLATLKLRWPHRFRVHPLGFMLGKNTFRDVFPEGEIALSHIGSSKFNIYSKTEYFGFPGSYLHFSFGIVEAATWPPLLWQRDAEIVQNGEARTLTNPERVKFNIVALTIDEPEFFPFTWSAFQ
ncbi:hypothetical protein [Burkholderia pseudomallei]|uniref:hypothetical protein n=1 Tax=Burkholderia pseudomallei TaxID=28450 RepID=UPI000975C6C1|nr:hypothetical protein [Burkholderia pseudomallei]OMQ78005.1 hypothetical protein AQ713_28660 [Burkholderia pseudomallei]